MSLFAGTEFYQPPRCDRCGILEEDCECPPEVVQPVWKDPATQTAAIRVEKRNRGKRVTVVRGLPAADNDLASLLKRLKEACGSGGTLQEDAIEIQGDCRDRVGKVLQEMKYRTRSG